MDHGWDDTDREKSEVLGEKSCSFDSLSATNPTWAGLKFYPDLRGERPATDRLELWHGFLVYNKRRLTEICWCIKLELIDEI
jgi:hypothetical protein